MQLSAGYAIIRSNILAPHATPACLATRTSPLVRSCAWQTSITLPAPAVEAAHPLYSPSWVDRLFDRIERRTAPPWVFYAGLALALVGLETAVKFADGTYPAWFHPYHLVLALTGVYYLALVHWLDRMAARILTAFRPIMTVDDATYARLAYELTTLPARPTLGFNAIWVAWSLLLLAAAPPTLLQKFAMFPSPLAFRR